PWHDNGIKVFGRDGYKLPDQVELEIEEEIFSQLNAGSGDEEKQVSSPSLPGDATLRDSYVQWLRMLVSSVTSLKVVVDCANGAASALAPQLFHAEFTHNSPNGRNINEHCGALHPEVVAREAVARKADIGICFDGDADRALFADHRGNVVNGDAVMLLLA